MLYEATFGIAGQVSVTLTSGAVVMLVRSGSVTLSGSDGSVSPPGSDATSTARTPLTRYTHVPAPRPVVLGVRSIAGTAGTSSGSRMRARSTLPSAWVPSEDPPI